MKITKQLLKQIIEEELKKLDNDGNTVSIGPPDDLPPYHDSTRDDNEGGYTRINKKKVKIKVYKQKGDDIETFEVD